MDPLSSCTTCSTCLPCSFPIYSCYLKCFICAPVHKISFFTTKQAHLLIHNLRQACLIIASSFVFFVVFTRPVHNATVSFYNLIHFFLCYPCETKTAQIYAEIIFLSSLWLTLVTIYFDFSAWAEGEDPGVDERKAGRRTTSVAGLPQLLPR